MGMTMSWIGVKWVDGPLPWLTLVLYCTRVKAQGFTLEVTWFISMLPVWFPIKLRHGLSTIWRLYEVGVRAVRFSHFLSFKLTHHARTKFIEIYS